MKKPKISTRPPEGTLLKIEQQYPSVGVLNMKVSEDGQVVALVFGSTRNPSRGLQVAFPTGDIPQLIAALEAAMQAAADLASKQKH